MKFGSESEIKTRRYAVCAIGYENDKRIERDHVLPVVVVRPHEVGLV